jgi:chromosome segregation and condensation protein ScpB
MRGTEHGAGMAQQQEQLAAIDVKKTFWEDLKRDLEVVAQEWTLLLEKQAATALTAVITVARATMTQYQIPSRDARRKSDRRKRLGRFPAS